jgi:hypothetical protein
MLMGRFTDIGEVVFGDAHILLLGGKEEEFELNARFGLDMGESITFETKNKAALV